MGEHRQTGLQEILSPPISRYMSETLGCRSGLDGENLSLFQKIITELTTSLTEGHICIELTAEQREVVRSSRLVAEETDGALVLSGERFYFGRYYRYESELAAALKKRIARAGRYPAAASALQKIAPLVKDPQQKRAVDIGLNKSFSIVSGGPGTGKTTLVRTILRLLLEEHGSSLQIALAAPTGKAAMRLHESIFRQTVVGPETPPEPVPPSDLPAQAVTLHRLLGLGRFSNEPIFNRTNPLPFDMVIVDEASMVDLAMMARLVDALKPEARLILLGDRDQLASVESGAVLADCIDSLPDNVAMLETSYRFSAGIADLAGAVKAGAAERAWRLCSPSEAEGVSIAGSDWFETIVDIYHGHMKRAAETVDAEAYLSLIQQFNCFRILCAVRRGRRGVEQINREIESRLVDLKEGPGREWYRGRPVLITRNDSSHGLFNGDIGICLPDPDNGELRVWFESASNSMRSFLPGQLPAHETAWALTIHKSQGSEFDEVCIVLPEKDNPILCRELLYTAVTRAKKRIALVVGEELFRLTVARKTARRSGLADRLKQ